MSTPTERPAVCSTCGQIENMLCSNSWHLVHSAERHAVDLARWKKLQEAALVEFPRNIQGSPDNYEFASYALTNLPALIQHIEALTLEVQRWKLEADINEQCARSYDLKQPFCEHENRYAFTDDGGKTGKCVMCENARLREERDADTQRLDWLERPDADGDKHNYWYLMDSPNGDREIRATHVWGGRQEDRNTLRQLVDAARASERKEKQP